MYQDHRRLNFFCLLLLVYVLHNPIWARVCYECSSTFPSTQICLPPCSATYRQNSSCLLTRNTTLGPREIGSLRAGHIAEEPFIVDAVEKDFLYGEEYVYFIPSEGVGWSWEYGPITYGCDTDNCNDPRIINRLPDALNARIPDAVLDQVLTGDTVSQCYTCSKCANENTFNEASAGCESISCPNHACALFVSRSRPNDTLQCGNDWRLLSFCLGARSEPQVEMTLMHYTRSKTTVVYQLEANCYSDNCNSFNTFKRLKNALTINPDLTCFNNIDNTTTTSTTTTTTTRPTTSTTTSTSTRTTTTTTTTSRPGGSTTSRPATTTTRGNSAAPFVMSSMLTFFLLIFLF